jgi:hypothetical protein
MDSLLDLSRTLTKIVEATEGVREVYPASRFRELMAGTLLDAENEGARISVHHRGGSLDVYVNICVDADHSLPTVLRSVSDAISAALRSAATEPTALASSALTSTTVSSIHSPPAHIAVTASRIL